MKKRMLSLGVIVSLFSTQLIAPLMIHSTAVTVQAATEVNFDQGSMSEEEYINNIIQQFLELENIEIVTTDVNDPEAEPSKTIFDFKNLNMVSTSVVDGVESQTYIYSDGSYVSPITTTIEGIRAYNFDNEAAVDELAQEVEGKLLIENYPQLAASNENVADSFAKMVDTMTSYENQEGVIVASSDVTPVEDLLEIQPSYGIYPAGSTVQNVIKVDPQEQALIFDIIIDVNEEKEETTEESMGISFSDFLTDSHTSTVMKATTETVPAIDQLENTITKEELDALVEEKGLENY